MKIYLFTPAFCKAKLLEDALEFYYAQNHPKVEHVITDNHYPVNKEENRAEIKRLAEKFGCHYVDSGKDLGWHEGMNNAVKVLGITEDDMILGCDPDDRASPGTIQALIDVMTEDRSKENQEIGFLGINFWVLPWKMRDHGLVMKEIEIAGHKVWVHPSVEMWNVGAFNTKLVFSMGGFSQMSPYYGGLEVRLHNEWKKHGMKLCYLKDYTADYRPLDRNDPTLFDPDYGAWKVDAGHKGYKKSFEEWLQEKGKLE
jgi:hypothetical protein